MTDRPYRPLMLAGLAMLSLPTIAQAQDLAPRQVTVDVSRAGAPVDRFFDLSVGSENPAVLERPDAQAQLKVAVDEVGFRYIRFHAIFTDALNTVRVIDGKTTYDWTRIDRLYDALLKKGIRPFVELSFTPQAMRTSEQTVFYWKANSSHPKPDAWRDLVTAFVAHAEHRYGAAEVRRWYFEVWNEPNLAPFWEKADKQAYFGLYDLTARAVKGVDSSLRVGGPATAGSIWIADFLKHVADTKTPIDFVTGHSYGVVSGYLDQTGKEDTKLLSSNNAIISDVKRARQQIEGSAFPGLPLYVTEWSTSFSPRDLVHDSYISAPYILSKIKGTQGLAQAMSYWTYSDLFEETGPPPTPFHGGFGLLNREGIRKPSFFAYKYLNALRGRSIAVEDDMTMASVEGEHTTVVLWDWQQPKQDTSNRVFFSKLLPATPSATIHFHAKHLRPGQYRLRVYRTGYRANDPFSRYIDWGMPEALSRKQVAELKTMTKNTPEANRVVTVAADGIFETTLPMRSNDVVSVDLAPVR